MSCVKMAETVDLPFGLSTRVGQKKQKFNRIRQVAPIGGAVIGGHIGASRRIRLNRPSAAAMRPYVKLL